MTARAAIARQSHDHQFGEVLERDRHDTAFGEVAIRGTAGRHTWVAGLAVERDAYTASGCAPVRLHLHRAGRIRTVRRHRVSTSVALGKRSSGCAQRVRHVFQSSSVGDGARGSLDEQALRRNRFLRADPDHRRDRGRRPDASRGPAAGRGRTRAERVVRPVAHRRSAVVHSDRVRIPHQRPSACRAIADRTCSAPCPTRRQTWGSSSWGRCARRHFRSPRPTPTCTPARPSMLSNKTFLSLRATVQESSGMWEAEDVGRVGVEWYYTGRQSLEENPYRTDQRAVHDCGSAGGEAVRADSSLRQRREPYGCEADAMGSAAPPDTRASMAAGPSTRGRPSRAGTSTGACASVSRGRWAGAVPIRGARPGRTTLMKLVTEAPAKCSGLRPQLCALGTLSRTVSVDTYAQQVGPQHAFGSGFLARMNALATLPSTCGAIRSTSTPTSVRNARASSTW